MKIYNLSDIDKKFRDTIDFIDESDNENVEYFLNVKVGTLKLAVHTYKEQLKQGIAIHSNRSKIISALESIENILDSKLFSINNKKEIIEKLFAAFKIYGEHLPHNQPN